MRRKETEIFKVFVKVLTDLKMNIRMLLHFVLVLLILQIIFNLVYFYRFENIFPDAKILYLKTLLAKILSEIPILNTFNFFLIGQWQNKINAIQFCKYYEKLFAYYAFWTGIGFKKSFFVWPLLPCFYFFFWFKSRSVLKEEYIRGTIILSEREFSKKITKNKINIKLNEKLSIPFDCENRHVFTIGKPGAGKTQLFCRVIEKIVERNEKAVIYDFKGDYISRFYDPKTDIIFNPLDQRSVGWCIFNEVKSLPNLEAICSSLIPSTNKTETFWDNAARDILFSALLYCFKHNLTTNEEIYGISVQSREALLEKFAKTKGCERGIKPLEDVKVGASVLSTFSQYVKFLEYTRNMKGEFSIRDWVADEKQRGRIFITNYAEISQVMEPLLSLFIDTFANRILMLPESLERRIFLFLDEFGTLQKLNNILNMIKLSRSFGGSIWIGIQDIGQIENIYGKESTKTIINSCGNSIIFGVDEPKTAQDLSNKIGDRERSNIDNNFSIGVHEYKDGHSVSERTTLEKAVLPADIMGLMDLSFYFKLAKFSEFTKSELTYKEFPAKNCSFIENISQIGNEDIAHLAKVDNLSLENNIFEKQEDVISI